MYTFSSRVRYSETDENGRLSMESVIDYMQDCTNFESEDLGVGLKYLKEKQIMWVLSSWQIVMDYYPFFGETMTIGTQSYGYEKIFGYRNFLLSGEDGKRIAIANSTWVLMDMKRGRPKMVTPEIGDVYGKYEPLEMDYAPRKIKLPDGGVPTEGFLVKEYHLDTNHHVNNGQYVRMAMLAADLRGGVKELRVDYKKQALLGDEIVPVVYREDGHIFVSLNDLAGKAYAVVLFLTK